MHHDKFSPLTKLIADLGNKVIAGISKNADYSWLNPSKSESISHPPMTSNSRKSASNHRVMQLWNHSTLSPLFNTEFITRGPLFFFYVPWRLWV
jgi:hypothetical protein